MKKIALSLFLPFCVLLTGCNLIEEWFPEKEHGEDEQPVIPPMIAQDLSAAGAANCYIVSESGYYKFKVVRGSGIKTIGDEIPTEMSFAVNSVEVLWESFCSDEKP